MKSLSNFNVIFFYLLNPLEFFSIETKKQNLSMTSTGSLTSRPLPRMGLRSNAVPYVKPNKGGVTLRQQHKRRNSGENNSKEVFSPVKILSPSKLLSPFNDKNLNLPKLLTYEMKVRILSNFGNPDYLTTSEIDVLDENKSTIQNLSCFLTKGKDETISRIVNQQMIKGSIGETWVHSFSPEKSSESVEINFHFRSASKPTAIRIFPSSYLVNANINEFIVLLNGKFVFRGNASDSFCTSAKFDFTCNYATSVAMQIKSEDKALPHVLRDRHGILPFNLTTSFSFSVLEGYSEDGIVGIRKIVFFDTSGNPIKSSQMEITSNNVVSSFPVSRIFKDELTVVTEHPWRGSFNENNSINVIFKYPAVIAAVGFLMPSIISTENEIGVKKMAVKINGVMRWAGKLPKEKLLNDGTSENRAFFVFLTNHRETRKTIPESFR
ncbi:hypothetical protein TRFO_25442 [Tritrichomonas foetus]|uniref:KATNIP domain-containing protein n=1 Tax=Tritrichomonas foetus TaxID=1144522 RepID=A0A1J4KA29_9EUKA|nr:hypothetical protein TRFO_25442 [Tritrichomonas foetus]|eukprot:OHT06548.1 hypothetical protein TRFO_25442 [Tritrichomonas foetus]